MEKSIKERFPIFEHHPQLIYLDNAATTHKPKQVMDGLLNFYQSQNANIHRGIYQLSQKATKAYESARQKVSRFLNAESHDEIIFTSGTTQSLNFLAERFVEPLLEEGDILLTTVMEHHSNFVPWQMIATKKKAKIVYLDLDDSFKVILPKTVPEGVKFLVIQQVSNVTGTIQNIEKISLWAKQHGIKIIVDGAQAVGHLPVDLQTLKVDAYCFSGHKMYGPTGIGVCYLNKQHHESTLPFLYGGEMVHHVTFEQTSFKEAPYKFEGGTPPIAQAIGLGQAVDFIESLGLKEIHQHERSLANYLYQGLMALKGIELYHSIETGILSFNLHGIHPHDAVTFYDLNQIALRAGHHCAQPLMKYLKVAATLRVSLSIYNTKEDIDALLDATIKVKEFFNGF